jgi:hypothetical protein
VGFQKEKVHITSLNYCHSHFFLSKLENRTVVNGRFSSLIGFADDSTFTSLRGATSATREVN